MLGAGTDPELEFGGLIVFLVKRFLTLLFAIGNITIWAMVPGPPGSVPGWEGTSASRVLTVSEAKAFQCTKPLHRLKATKSVIERDICGKIPKKFLFSVMLIVLFCISVGCCTVRPDFQTLRLLHLEELSNPTPAY